MNVWIEKVVKHKGRVSLVRISLQGTAKRYWYVDEHFKSFTMRMHGSYVYRDVLGMFNSYLPTKETP